MQAKTSDFTYYQVLPYPGVEELLVTEVPMDVQRRFLAAVLTSADYPAHLGPVAATASDDEVRAHLRDVLKARKGRSWGYAAQLVASCHGHNELPATLVELLLEVDRDLRPPAATLPSPVPDGEAASGGAVNGD